MELIHHLMIYFRAASTIYYNFDTNIPLHEAQDSSLPAFLRIGFIKNQNDWISARTLHLLVLHGEVILPLGLDDRLPQVLQTRSSRTGPTQVDNPVDLVVGRLNS